MNDDMILGKFIHRLRRSNCSPDLGGNKSSFLYIAL